MPTRTSAPPLAEPVAEAIAAGYVLTSDRVEHEDRARSILSNHPEVRQLFGPNPWTGLLAVAVISLQLALAVASTRAPLWAVVLLAYFVGAYVNHALWVMVHESAHYLIFRNKTLNRLVAVLCNLPMVIPSTTIFCVYHLMHHKYMGDVDRDADLPRPGVEAWLLRHGFAGRLAWQCFFPLLQSLRTIRLDKRARPASWQRWVGINIAVQLAFNAAWYFVFGFDAFVYLLLSVFFSIGPHLLGARWIQEHYQFRDGQETYSYYGSLNLVALNVGYHNEHHDLTQIPWHRLPKLKSLAPEMYDRLYSHRSWLWLWLRFLFDRKLEMVRIVRRQAAGSEPEGLHETAHCQESRA